MVTYYEKYLKYKKKYINLKRNTDNKNKSNDENFVVTVCDDINKIISHNKYEAELKKIIIKKYKGLSTGNQFGAGTTEYFFAVEPKLINNLTHELNKLNDMLRVNKYVSIDTY